VELHPDRDDRLDSRGPIVLLRLRGTLPRALASQFWSTSIESNARQRGDSDRVCADLLSLLQNVEQAFLFIRIVVRTGSLPACLGAVRDDRDL